MLYRTLTSRMSIAALMSAGILVAAATVAQAEGKAAAKLAVKTTIGPSDAPVRTAQYSEADRSQVKFQTVGWRGRGYYGAYYGYPAYYPSYTYYYPAAPVYVVPRRAYYAPAPAYVPYGTYYYYGW